MRRSIFALMIFGACYGCQGEIPTANRTAPAVTKTKGRERARNSDLIALAERITELIRSENFSELDGWVGPSGVIWFGAIEYDAHDANYSLQVKRAPSFSTLWNEPLEIEGSVAAVLRKAVAGKGVWRKTDRVPFPAGKSWRIDCGSGGELERNEFVGSFVGPCPGVAAEMRWKLSSEALTLVHEVSSQADVALAVFDESRQHPPFSLFLAMNGGERAVVIGVDVSPAVCD